MKLKRRGRANVGSVRALERERRATGAHNGCTSKNRKVIKPLYRPNEQEVKELNELTKRHEGFEALGQPEEWGED